MRPVSASSLPSRLSSVSARHIGKAWPQPRKGSAGPSRAGSFHLWASMFSGTGGEQRTDHATIQHQGSVIPVSPRRHPIS